MYNSCIYLRRRMANSKERGSSNNQHPSSRESPSSNDQAPINGLFKLSCRFGSPCCFESWISGFGAFLELGIWSFTHHDSLPCFDRLNLNALQVAYSEFKQRGVIV